MGAQFSSRLIARALALCLAHVGALAAQYPFAIRADLDAASEQINTLNPLSIWNYSATPAGSKPDPDAPPAVINLAGSDYPEFALKSLLADPSPRIRTLALELLFKKQQAQLLPVIVEHVGDDGTTFDKLVYYDYSDFRPPKSRRALQTVGEFAKAMAGFYGVRGDFTTYWAARKDRSYWFTWLQSQMSRITGGLPTLNRGVKEQLVPFRQMLDKLPPLDRNLYLIWLQSTFAEPALADDADLREAVRNLGRDNVLAIAEGNPPGGDPDLQPSWSHLQYRRVAALVLDHAIGILQPSDADRLAAVIERERERVQKEHLPETFVSPSYTIAQARLLPDKAGEILHAEINLRPGKFEASARGQLAAALLEARSNQELPFLRNFFYTEPATVYGPEAQVALIRALAPDDRPRMEELLNDPRHSSLTPWIMVEISRRFPDFPRALLLDWFYTHEHVKDEWWSGQGVGYFLAVNRDPELLAGILRDARLSTLPLPVLLQLEQALIANSRLPKSFFDSFPHIGEVAKFFAANGGPPVSGQAVAELIRFLREGAAYVGAS